MPDDPVLAILALLFLWLLFRLIRIRSGGEEVQEGRSSVKARGIGGLQVIETLPPRPLAFAATVRVAAPHRGTASFEVDLSELYCPCPDFQRRRRELPEDAIGRVCEHVSEALKETGASTSFDPLLRAIVESGETKERYYQVELSSGRKAAIGHSEGSDLLHVIAATRPKDERGAAAAEGPYRRYAYSRDRGAWLDGQRPPGSGEIRQIIPKLPLGS